MLYSKKLIKVHSQMKMHTMVYFKTDVTLHVEWFPLYVFYVFLLDCRIIEADLMQVFIRPNKVIAIEQERF